MEIVWYGTLWDAQRKDAFASRQQWGFQPIHLFLEFGNEFMKNMSLDTYNDSAKGNQSKTPYGVEVQWRYRHVSPLCMWHEMVTSALEPIVSWIVHSSKRLIRAMDKRWAASTISFFFNTLGPSPLLFNVFTFSYKSCNFTIQLLIWFVAIASEYAQIAACNNFDALDEPMCRLWIQAAHMTTDMLSLHTFLMTSCHTSSQSVSKRGMFQNTF